MLDQTPAAVRAHSIGVKKANKSKKRKRYELHAWLGFHLALIMSVVLLTGTIATISNEIDWLIYPEMRVSPDGSRVSWGDMENAVKTRAPDDRLNAIVSGAGDHFAYRATLFPEDGGWYFLHINQWTGEVTGRTHPLTVQRFFRDLHRYLFMPSVFGLPIVASMAFVLLLSLYTGWRTVGRLTTAATRLRRDRGIRVFIGDLHKSSGVWAIWFMILMIVTGTWYLAEFVAPAFGSRFEPARPVLSETRLSELDGTQERLPVDTLVAIARKQIPDWTPTDVYYPSRDNMPVSVLGATDDFLIRPRANRVFIDPYSGEVLLAQKSSEISWVAYVNEMADPLHFGFFGGLATKLIWFVFGLMLTGLSVTGVWLTYKRLRTVAVSKTQFATMPILMLAMISFYFYVQRF